MGGFTHQKFAFWQEVPINLAKASQNFNNLMKWCLKSIIPVIHAETGQVGLHTSQIYISV